MTGVFKTHRGGSVDPDARVGSRHTPPFRDLTPRPWAPGYVPREVPAVICTDSPRPAAPAPKRPGGGMAWIAPDALSRAHQAGGAVNAQRKRLNAGVVEALAAALPPEERDARARERRDAALAAAAPKPALLADRAVAALRDAGRPLLAHEVGAAIDRGAEAIRTLLRTRASAGVVESRKLRRRGKGTKATTLNQYRIASVDPWPPAPDGWAVLAPPSTGG